MAKEEIKNQAQSAKISTVAVCGETLARLGADQVYAVSKRECISSFHSDYFIKEYCLCKISAGYRIT